MRIFITGTAGFIGFHLARRLLAEGHEVAGYDGMTPYYDLKLKRDRHDLLTRFEKFRAVEGMLEDMDRLRAAAESARPELIVHLAAQAGVRYSLENPRAYVESNLVGAFNVLEIARELKPRHLMLASTSSVYGANPDMPYAENHRTDWPATFYAATKKANEAMSHSYAHLWRIPTTCFRFFTVYGPWGRPDMALFKFVEAIEQGRPIDVYGRGEMQRDFTYIDDLIEGILRLSACIPGEPRVSSAPEAPDSLSPAAPWRVVNIAGGKAVGLMDFIAAIENSLGRKAVLNLLPMQPGDMKATFADHRLLQALTGYRPATPVEVGVKAFVDWWKSRA
ncbi:NAD-dependent epimerase/dehydratase family protein [Rhodoblastus acidophilus]|uniref:NAD-dependent epimerase/dehydratase family protein n=1 Tax=Candidatus Rhodoblastus alkanivorans TaxID=2954117 RepID=A0ABS9ZAK8_9HYPH|nr:NAD-dependent epimerase/dehydratase family protein [Candidatus Rhodoblastus alkanivorans]MCI4677772.1 NAD-dependent epimerase/dehydratase family protein [Candidatus Rhodoblastus alkanivorans]MCI4684730.1 NAD-dependent epimerase/dehydratase family protein [Candidatus Rhodoblastus alkanivorans]MDI4642052.1 NAD-dependent epimerase/dehydratase family protein [Rhodoblastus acidophilus]